MYLFWTKVIRIDRLYESSLKKKKNEALSRINIATSVVDRVRGQKKWSNGISDQSMHTSGEVHGIQEDKFVRIVADFDHRGCIQCIPTIGCRVCKIIGVGGNNFRHK
jgi:hypothetical protein